MEKQKNKTPLVRFPEFKDSWEHKQLNELLYVSKAKNTDLKYTKEDVLSVSGELGIVNQIEHLGRSYAGVSVHNYGVVELNQIVYTKSPLKANPYGIIKLNKHKAGIVSTLYAVYKVNNETDGQFIEYYFSLDANLNRYLRPLVRKGAKNDMKISNEYVLNDRIFAPQLKEQKKIAHFFTTIDQKLNQLQEKQTALEQYKKGVMQQIFSQKIRFKDDNGNDFPVWEVKKLGEIGETYNGLSGKTKDDFGTGKPYIQYKQIFDNSKINSDNFGFVQINKNDKQNKAKYGDIFFTVSSETPNEIGMSSVLLDDIEELYLNSFCFGFRPNSLDVLKPTFAQYLFRSKLMRKEIIKLAQGSTRYNMSKVQFVKIKFLLPTLKEQTKIANFLSKIDEKITNVNQQIVQTREWRKGLLQKMFVS